MEVYRHRFLKLENFLSQKKIDVMKNQKEKRHKKKALRRPIYKEKLVIPSKDDDWFGPFSDGKICVYHIEWVDKSTAVGVYGFDEKALVKYFSQNCRKASVEFFESVSDHVVSYRWAKENGFES